MKSLNIYLISILLTTSYLYAQEESYWDKVSSGTSSLWGKTKEYGEKAFDTTKEYSSDTWEQTKKYSHQGKNMFIEKTLLHGINALTDNTKIKINKFEIDNKTNVINMAIYLNGEDKELNIEIKNFTWGITENKEDIVFEDLDISLDIEWLDYLLKDSIKRAGGYLIVPNKASTFSLLYSIKPDIKLTKNITKKEDKFDFVYYKYDENYFKINQFKVKDKHITTDIRVKGSTEHILCNIKSFDIQTANKKTILAIRNIKFAHCNKPWIQSFIENQNNELYVDFTDKLYSLFKGDI
jgi:hypothetical protein